MNPETTTRITAATATTLYTGGQLEIQDRSTRQVGCGEIASIQIGGDDFLLFALNWWARGEGREEACPFYRPTQWVCVLNFKNHRELGLYGPIILCADGRAYFRVTIRGWTAVLHPPIKMKIEQGLLQGL